MTLWMPESGCRARRGLKFGLLLWTALVAAGCQESPKAPSPVKPAATPAPATTTTATQTQAQADDPDEAELLAKMKAPVATSKFGTLTRMDILNSVRAASIEPMPSLPNDNRTAYEQLVSLPNDALTTTARWIVSRYQSSVNLALPENAATKTKIEQAFDAGQRRRTIMGSVLRKELYDKLPDLSEADLQAYYDKHQAEYRQPFQFYMRHLILMTYVDYTVKDGDSLESIAERISGDKSKAGEIRWNTEQRPLRREEGKQFRPLAAGEKLLVPMDEAASLEVKKKLEAMLATIGKDGMTFEQLARNNSMSSPPGEIIGPLPTGTKEMLPEILKYAKETPAGDLSPIFRTPHGWQVIQIVKKRAEGIQPLKEVKNEVRQSMLQEAQTKISAELIPRMYSDPALKIDYDLIAKSGDDLSTSTVVARVGNEQLLWGAAKQAWIHYNQSKDRDMILAAFKTVYELQQMLVVNMAREDLKDPKSAVNQAIQEARRLSEGQAWLAAQAIIAARTAVTSDTLHGYYDQFKDEHFKAVPKVTFISMERRLSPEQRQKPNSREDLIALYNLFKTDLDSLKTADDFKAKAAEVNAKLAGQPPAPPSALTPTPFNELDTHIQAAIEKLEVGQFSPPTLIDNSYRLASILLLSNVSEGYVPFKDVAAQVDQLAVEQAYHRQLDDLVEKRLAEAEFKMVP